MICHIALCYAYNFCAPLISMRCATHFINTRHAISWRNRSHGDHASALHQICRTSKFTASKCASLLGFLPFFQHLTINKRVVMSQVK